MANDLLMAKIISNWVGAFFFWCLGGFRGEYKNYIAEAKSVKNIWIGFFLIVLLILSIGFILYSV